METATRGRKQKWRLKEAKGLGPKQRIEEAERREPHESDQGLDPGQWTQPGPKGSEDRPSNGWSIPSGTTEIVPAKIRKKPCLGRVFFVLNFTPDTIGLLSASIDLNQPDPSATYLVCPTQPGASFELHHLMRPSDQP